MIGILEQFAGNLVLALLAQIIKNPNSKATYRAIMLSIYQDIKIAFAGDPDFN